MELAKILNEVKNNIKVKKHTPHDIKMKYGVTLKKAKEIYNLACNEQLWR